MNLRALKFGRCQSAVSQCLSVGSEPQVAGPSPRARQLAGHQRYHTVRALRRAHPGHDGGLMVLKHVPSGIGLVVSQHANIGREFQGPHYAANR